MQPQAGTLSVDGTVRVRLLVPATATARRAVRFARGPAAVEVRALPERLKTSGVYSVSVTLLISNAPFGQSKPFGWFVVVFLVESLIPQNKNQINN